MKLIIIKSTGGILQGEILLEKLVALLNRQIHCHILISIPLVIYKTFMDQREKERTWFAQGAQSMPMRIYCVHWP